MPPPVDERAPCICGVRVEPEKLTEAPGVTWVWEESSVPRKGIRRVRWHSRCHGRWLTRTMVEATYPR